MSAARKFKRACFFIAAVFCAILAATGIAALAGMGAYEKITWAHDPAEKVFEANCGKCHSTDRPKSYAKSPEEWRNTVKEMARKFETPPDPRDMKTIEALLVRKRSMTPKQAFDLRCGKCHPAAAVDPYLARDFQALALLVRKHVVQYNYAVEVWQGEMALEHMKTLRPRVAADPETASAQTLFEQDCRVCHTVTFRYKSMFDPPRTQTQWAEVVERMRQKAPDLILEDHVPVILRQIESMANAKIR